MIEALLNLKNKREETRRLGINHSLFINKLNISLLNMKTNKPYKAIKLPIKDSELLAVGKELVCEADLNGAIKTIWMILT